MNDSENVQHERFRIMFTLRPPGLRNLLVVGVDQDNGCLFNCLLSSPNDNIDLTHTSRGYPPALLSFLQKYKNDIDRGYYALRTWEISLYDNSIKEVTPLDIEKIRDRGMKKWKEFMLPEHSKALQALKREDKKVSKPLLDEYEMEQINQVLTQSLHGNLSLNVRIYEDGYIRELEKAKIVKVDTFKRRIGVVDMYGHLKFVQLEQVIAASEA